MVHVCECMVTSMAVSTPGCVGPGAGCGVSCMTNKSSP